MQTCGIEVWRKRTKAKIVAGFGGSCNKCGYNRCFDALDLHHIDANTKEFNISEIFKSPRAWEKVIVELKKCVLLCNRCHKELHAGLWDFDNLTVRFFNEENCDHLVGDKTGTCPICDSDVFWNNKTCSRACAARLARNVHWPSDNEFLDLLENHSQEETARILGVSGSGVKKHLKRIRSLGALS